MYMTGKHRDGEQNPLEQAQVSEEKDKVIADDASHADQGEFFFFKPRLGWISKQHKSPLSVS